MLIRHIQYRSGLIEGRLVETGLTINPWPQAPDDATHSTSVGTAVEYTRREGF
ncbi:hypothetical protein GA0115280_100240 [Streptomyces sp. Cmuel-A718b]|nr:hypothetical protein GA0115280_100240 [Streptomyces sp. Cmuel-A718b]